MVDPPRSAQEPDKRDLFTGDGLSSCHPIDLVKDSCPLEESASSKAACCGTGNRGKEQIRYRPLDLHKLYHALPIEQHVLNS